MYPGEIVYYPYKGVYIKYTIKKIFDNELLVVTTKTLQKNWLTCDEVVSSEHFKELYNNEEIYD